MTNDRSLKKIRSLLLASAFAVSTHAMATDISTEPLNTYSAPSSTDVKPNVLFVLDDSGSMDWDFMPDWACSPYSVREPECRGVGQNPASPRSEYWFRNAGYNGVYYNPAVRYRPPVAIDSSGAANTTSYPSMTGMSAATGADINVAVPNWKAVKDDAYGVQSSASTKSDVAGDGDKPPYFFTFVAGEYCKEPSLKTCVTSNAKIDTGNPSTSYLYPATLRWCDSSALTNCRATFSSTFRYARAPSPSVTTITVAGSNGSDTVVSGITVNDQQIMAGSTSGSTTYATVAQRIVDQINKCTIRVSGNCGVRGYHASSSGNVVTIIAPTDITFDPTVTKSGPMTLAATRFSKGSVPGSNLPTVITSDINSYPKSTARTDCAGSTCTYAAEMTNYANWWTD